MSEQRTTDILERMLSGSEFLICNYDDDIDIAVPKRYSITTGAKKAVLNLKITYTTAATITVNTGMVIGTGGSPDAGTAISFVKRDQASSLTPVTVVKRDYVLGSSGQTDGTAIYSDVLKPLIETVIKFKLKASTIYSVVITSVADNNSGNVIFEVDEI
jgi:hypothetical protein